MNYHYHLTLIILLAAGLHAGFLEEKQACQKGDGAACTQAANYLMETKQRYEAGVESGLAKALVYAKRGCALEDADGCLFAAMVLYYGDDWEKIAADKEAGRRYLKRACELGKEDICSYLPSF